MDIHQKFSKMNTVDSMPVMSNHATGEPKKNRN